MTVTKDMTVTKILNCAADLVEVVGWTQGSFVKYDYESNQPVAWCLVGEINECQYGDATTVTRLDHRISTVLPRFVRAHPTRWNDSPDTTREQVVKMLRKAAKRAERKGL